MTSLFEHGHNYLVLITANFTSNTFFSHGTRRNQYLKYVFDTYLIFVWFKSLLVATWLHLYKTVHNSCFGLDAGTLFDLMMMVLPWQCQIYIF